MNNSEVTLRGYRIVDPKLTTWNRLLDARDTLRERVGLKLGEQIGLIQSDPELLQEVRKWMQVSDRHRVTRREVFNSIKHVHEASMWLGNWKMILHVYPLESLSNHILIRVESGAILDQWFEWFIDPASHDQYEDMSYPCGSKKKDESREAQWSEQMKLTPHPYRLTVCNDLQEFASLCV